MGGKGEKNMHFGIEMKKGYNKNHLIAIPLVLVSFGIITTFVNSQMIFLLRNKIYFEVPQNQIGTAINDILFYSIMANMFATLFVG